MCLAIFKPAKVMVPEAHLNAGWQSNSDGAGFAFIKDGKVVAAKGYMNLKDFIAAYTTAAARNKKSPFLIHFRIRSMGEKGEVNTHPFPIKGGMLIHNGTIDGTDAEWQKGPSDTSCFAEKFYEALAYDTVSKHKKEFEEAVSFNKIAMLYDNGQHIILNESRGHWTNDVWYSNHGYTASSSSSVYSGGTGYQGFHRHGMGDWD